MKCGRFKNGDILIIVKGRENSTSNNYYLQDIRKLQFIKYVDSRSHKIKCRLKLIDGYSSAKDYDSPQDNGWTIHNNNFINLFEDVLMLESEKEIDYQLW